MSEEESDITQNKLYVISQNQNVWNSNRIKLRENGTEVPDAWKDVMMVMLHDQRQPFCPEWTSPDDIHCVKTDFAIHSRQILFFYSFFMLVVMTNTRRQLIGWCLRRSTAPRWQSSVVLDWARSLTLSNVRTPLLTPTYRASLRAQV